MRFFNWTARIATLPAHLLFGFRPLSRKKIASHGTTTQIVTGIPIAQKVWEFTKFP